MNQNLLNKKRVASLYIFKFLYLYQQCNFFKLFTSFIIFTYLPKFVFNCLHVIFMYMKRNFYLLFIAYLILTRSSHLSRLFCTDFETFCPSEAYAYSYAIFLLFWGCNMDNMKICNICIF